MDTLELVKKPDKINRNKILLDRFYVADRGAQVIGRTRVIAEEKVGVANLIFHIVMQLCVL